jgi:Ca2+-binding RTX toxin-like protein
MRVSDDHEVKETRGWQAARIRPLTDARAECLAIQDSYESRANRQAPQLLCGPITPRGTSFDAISRLAFADANTAAVKLQSRFSEKSRAVVRISAITFACTYRTGGNRRYAPKNQRGLVVMRDVRLTKMGELVHKIMYWLQSTWANVPPRSRRKHAVQCQLEALEARALMAGITCSGGTMDITGSTLSDVAVVSTINGQIQGRLDQIVYIPSLGVRVVVPVAQKSCPGINKIVFRGYDGNDGFTNRTSVASGAYGGSGNDTLTGGAGNDSLWGESGNDTLRGGAGQDRIYGGVHDDRMYGEAGADLMRGGSGNDILYGGSQNDTLYGEAGRDRLLGDDGNDWLLGGLDNDVLVGGQHDDSLWGNAGNDQLFGDYDENGDDVGITAVGNDTLRGGTGSDVLMGQNGNDILYATDEVYLYDSVIDYLWGGNGADRFVSNSVERKDLVPFEDTNLNTPV